MPHQVDLRACWHTAAPGRLTAWQQAFACGLREASKELYGGHVAVTRLASKLQKTDATGKAYSQDAPEQGSLSESSSGRSMRTRTGFLESIAAASAVHDLSSRRPSGHELHARACARRRRAMSRAWKSLWLVTVLPR